MIVDNLNGRLVGIDPDGQVGYSVSIAQRAIVDIAVDESGKVVALSHNLDSPGLLTIDGQETVDFARIGREEVAHTIGILETPEGLSLVTEQGQVPITPSGFSEHDLKEMGARSGNVRQFEVGTRVVEVKADRFRGATLSVDESSVAFPFGAPIREIRPLGLNVNGDIVILLHEVLDAADVVVAQPWIAGISLHGSLSWVARYPIEEAVYVPESPATVTDDGRVLALVGHEDSLQIRELRKVSAPDATPWNLLMLAATVPEPRVTEWNAVRASCVSGSTMENTAWGYINTSKYLDTTDLNTYCARRAKPRYLGGAGTYYSVPYQWGGFHTASQYKGYMSNNQKRAGDYTNDAWTSCASGVDCSGFVSRCWQLSSKYYTGSLPNISHTISEATQGDIYNKVGHHVVLVDYESGTSGVMVFEATTRSGLDRVVHNMLSWSYLSGYSRRRYNNKC